VLCCGFRCQFHQFRDSAMEERGHGERYRNYIEAQQGQQDSPLMFANRESTVERKQRIRNELQRMNTANNESVRLSGELQREAGLRAAGVTRAAPPSPVASRSRPEKLPGISAATAGRANVGRGAAPVPPPAVPSGGWQQQPPGGGGSSSAGDDARFRALERQCVELREEQRQILAWLTRTQESLAAEVKARERAEEALRTQLEQASVKREVVAARTEERMSASAHELAARIVKCEQQRHVDQAAVARATTAITDTISQLGSDLNALSFFVASGGQLGVRRPTFLHYPTPWIGNVGRADNPVVLCTGGPRPGDSEVG
jgi:hypothetical protein